LNTLRLEMDSSVQGVLVWVELSTQLRKHVGSFLPIQDVGARLNRVLTD